MPSYKLTYFPGRGKGENARQLFALAGVKYEDNRVEMGKWPELKASTPFGQLPVLEVDGKPLAQSNAISRYLAKQFGFAGANDFESAQIDAWADQFSDFFGEVRSYFVVAAGMGQGDKDKLYKDVVEPAREKFFPLLVKQLKANGTGFTVGSKVSWFDLLIAEHISTFETYQPGYADKYPDALALKAKIQAIPQIKKWLETRPVTPF